jgi:hypothetical protein
VAGKKTRKNPIVGCSIPWRRFSGPPRRRSASPHPHSPHLHPSPLPGGARHLPRRSHSPLLLPGPAPSPRQPTEEEAPPSTRRHSSSPPPSSAPSPCPSSSASRSGRRALPRPVLLFFLTDKRRVAVAGSDFVSFSFAGGPCSVRKMCWKWYEYYFSLALCPSSLNLRNYSTDALPRN